MLRRESNKDWMKGQIASSLLGRLRLRVDGLGFLFDARMDVAGELATIAGVRRVQVTPCTGSVLLEYDQNKLDSAALVECADMVLARYAMPALRARHASGKEETAEQPMTTARLAKRLAVNAGAMVLGNTLFTAPLLGGALANFTSLEALASLGLSAPMTRSALEGLRKDMRPNADFLTVTSIVASLMLGTPHSALMILALSDLAELMTSYTIERTRSSIKKMLSADDGDVWKVLEDGRVARTPIAQLHAGDTVAVHTGEKIAVDGVIASGVAVIDQSAITGEFVPVEKRAGDEVFAGTVVKSGNIQVKANKVGDQTVVSRIVGMVEASELKKAPIQRYADRFSNYLVPLNFLLCLSVWLVTHNAQKALKMLVIDYSCGIKLSTATAFSAAINTAVKQGVLIKGGAYIEQMSGANTVLLDKTGTVTTGEPNVVKIFGTRNVPEKFLLSMAAGLELRSEHPLARAILQRAEKDHLSYATVTDFEAVPGKGLRGKVAGKVIAGGNADFIRETCALPDDLQQAGDEMSADGITPLYFSLAGKAAGVIGVSDVVKESSAAAIAQMQTLGLQVVMLTGDNAATARHIGAAVGLDADHVIAGVLPAGKEAEVRALQKQGRVAMVGDGINDAPALTRAETGIAIGAGADVALDAADVVLVRSDLADVPAAVRLSRAVVRNIHQNLFWAFFYNAICIPLAAGVFTGFGITLNPMIASAAMSLSSVCVVTNALRLNTFDPRSAAHDAPPKRKAPVRASAPEIPCPTGSCPVQPAPENKTTQTEGTAMKKTIHIEGMMCGHCEATVKKALEALDGVQSAEVSHEKGTAVVSLTHDVADADLKTAVEARDYTVTGIDA